MLSALFLLQTLTLPIALPELALCVAEDHVRLEMQNLPADCKHDGQSRSALKHTDHMDDCADVPMFQHVRHVISNKPYSNIRPIYSVLFIPNVTEGNRTVSLFSVQNDFPSYSLQHAVHSVVLLI